MYVCMYVCVYIYICMCVCMYVCMYVCIYIYIYIYIYQEFLYVRNFFREGQEREYIFSFFFLAKCHEYNIVLISMTHL